jgi:hypothetical protein
MLSMSGFASALHSFWGGSIFEIDRDIFKRPARAPSFPRTWTRLCPEYRYNGPYREGIILGLNTS